MDLNTDIFCECFETLWMVIWTKSNLDYFRTTLHKEDRIKASLIFEKLTKIPII